MLLNHEASLFADAIATVWIVALVIALVVLLGTMALLLSLVKPWVQAFVAGAPVSALKLLEFRLKRLGAGAITNAYIMTRQANLPDGISVEDLAAHAAAGGDPELVVRAMIANRRDDGAELSFERACEVDLANKKDTFAR